ncbi:O-antigen ligase family protein [Changchengzhania lutea]|uniref:O-antigen ligase family protein n=1 Tax=Changchengzhania lutea TaxID=2049305 RepID=UPI00115EA008|nr:O-antigen ligase family protein [Changchengzhania lutea]
MSYFNINSEFNQNTAYSIIRDAIFKKEKNYVCSVESNNLTVVNKKYNYRIGLIKTFLFLSFAFFFPISQKISTINIGLLLIVTIISFKFSSFYFKTGLVLPICLYVLYCISLLYSSEMQLGIIEQKASLLVFPIIFMLNKSYKNHFNLILKYFVLGCISALIICEINAFYSSMDFSNFIFDSRIDKSMTFYDSLVYDQNFFFSYNFSFIHQAVYFSMYFLLAIAILFYYKIFKSSIIQNAFLIFLFFGIFQVLNKASFIILFPILMIKVYTVIKNKRNARIYILLFFIFSVPIFILNPRFKNFQQKRFIINQSDLKVKDFKKIRNIKSNDYNFRVMLWASALDLIKENPLIGIGAGGSHNRLYEVFAVKRQWYDKTEKYHAHNQYLQILLDLGIIGFSVFIFLLISFLCKVFKYNNENLKLIAINFALIIIINFLFESMFERYSGISFFVFFYCLFISDYSTEERLQGT